MSSTHGGPASVHPNGRPTFKSDRQQSVTDSKADLVSMEMESNLHSNSHSSFWRRRTNLEKLLAITSLFLLAALIILLAITIAKTVNGFDGSADNVCNTPACISAANALIENMDMGVDPCDDFYLYACGGFENRIRIPDDQSSRTQFAIIDDELENQLRDILESPEHPSESLVLKQARYEYEACMNLDQIEEFGLEPLKEILTIFGGWPVLLGSAWDQNSFKWDQANYIFRRHGYSSDYLFDFSIATDLKNSTYRTIYFDQPSLGLSREYLIQGLNNTDVMHYYNFMQKVAVLLGADPERAAEELRESLMFEIKLANISLPREERRNASSLYHPMTLGEMFDKFLTNWTNAGNNSPTPFNWTSYVNNLLTEDVGFSVNDAERVVVATPQYFLNLTEILNSEPRKNIANYMMWRVASASMGFMTKAAREIGEEYARNITGKKDEAPRWKHCVGAAAGSFSAAVGKMYVSRYFNEDAKKHMLEMVSDIRQQFKHILDEITWMDPETKRRAHQKLQTIKEYIGYPDEMMVDANLEDFYKGLQINHTHYFYNGINISIWSTNYQWRRLREPVNKTDWKRHANPAVVNAFYNSLENSIQFPAGILQGIFFNQERPNYLNYGGIGWVIGHEITHGFDDQGRQYDAEGNLKNWWEFETIDRFIEKTRCIIDQYSNYTAPQVNVSLNGINTQGENIADNGGIKEAYRAYNNWVSRHGEEKVLPGLNLNQRQLFWLGAANTWCSKYHPKSLEKRILTGAHSPGIFRVIGPFSNSEDFARDFQCPLGSPMNPTKKCRVW